MGEMTDMKRIKGIFSRRPTILKILFLTFGLMSFSSWGNAAGTTGVFHDTSMDFGSIKTVAVMPLVNLTREQQASDRVKDVFITALMASSGIYVVPAGEVARGVVSSSIANPTTPTPDEVVKLCKTVKVDALFTGVVREYGEVRSGTAMANVISMSMQLMEGQTGKIVWSADTTEGGIGVVDRLFGGGGQPLNDITQKAVNDLIDKLFK
jgi:hypothetical protein